MTNLVYEVFNEYQGSQITAASDGDSNDVDEIWSNTRDGRDSAKQ